MIRVGASAIGFVAGALNDCNRAKSPVTGRLQIPLVYFAPAAGIFYPIKTVYPTRRWFCTSTWCVGVISFGKEICYTAGWCVGVVFWGKCVFYRGVLCRSCFLQCFAIGSEGH